MEKKLLHTLDRLSSKTMGEIKSGSREFYRQIHAKLFKEINDGIQRAFGSASDALKKAAAGFKPDADDKRPVKEQLSAYISSRKPDGKMMAEAEQIIEKLLLPASVEALLPADMPLQANPMFRNEFEVLKMRRLCAAAGLSEPEAEKLAQRGIDLNRLNDKTLKDLVNAGDLVDEQARGVALAANLYHVFGENWEAVETAREKKFNNLEGHQLRSVTDLLKLEDNEWIQIIRESKMPLPAGKTAETLAAHARAAIENLFPLEVIADQLGKAAAIDLGKEIKAIRPLYRSGDRVLGLDDVKDLNARGKKAPSRAAAAAFIRLKQLHNLYPGLEVADVLEDPELSEAAKIETVKKRMGLLDQFLQVNSGLDLLGLDLTAESDDYRELRFADMDLADQKRVVSALKAYQRAHAITKNPRHTLQLLAAGYHSSLQIAQDSTNTFLGKTGFAAEDGRKYYHYALDVLTNTVNMTANVAVFVNDIFNAVNVANISVPTVYDYLKKIDGFDKLFGSLDYCRCEHCQSIFSPAAYYVDLMAFIEKHISKRNFIDTHREQHVLYLKNRRPDLWTLELNCRNTSELVPYLMIINQVLENYIAMNAGIADLDDRAAVTEKVYKDTLRTFRNSFQLPFMLPLDELHVLLAHFKKTPGEIADVLEAAEEIRALTAMKMSSENYALVTTADSAPAFINKLYNIAFQVQGGVIKPVDAQALIKSMGISRAELGDLVQTNAVTGTGPKKIRIKGEKRDPNSVQNDIERVYNLTYEALDAMHRFIRLLRHVNWHIPELAADKWRIAFRIGDLDMTLTAINAAGLSQKIMDRDAIIYLTKFIKIQQRLKLPVEELTGLWTDIPQHAAGAEKEDLFSRLFNLPDFVALDGLYPKNNTEFVHPSFRPAGPDANQADSAQHRLIAGLRVSDEELYLLIRHLGGPQALNLQNDGFKLTVKNLSLLYRHARLAKLFRLSISELFHLMTLNKAMVNGCIGGLDDVAGFIDFYDGYRRSGLTLDEIGFIAGDLVRDPAQFPDKVRLAADILDQVEKRNPLVFAETIFALYFEEITEDQSRALMAANAARLANPDPADKTRYRLDPAFDPAAALTIPAGLNLGGIQEPDLRGVLLAYHASEIIPMFLAEVLNSTVDKTRELIRMTGAFLSDGAYARELQKSDPPNKITELAERILPLSVLLKAGQLNRESLEFIRTHNMIFGNIDFLAPDLAAIESVRIYARLLGTEEEAQARRADVHAVLLDYHANQKFSQASETILGRLYAVDSGLIRSLQNKVPLANAALPALRKLENCVRLAAELGVGGDALKLIVSQNYDDLVQASDMVLSAFRAKYNDERQWQDKIQPFQDKILGLRRDALVAHLVSNVFPQFETANDLYHHFLLDTQLDGCARTSWVVAGASSLQLYIHRCLINLEQDAHAAGTPDKVHVLPEHIPQDEWMWRKNYRVWEANRKVFLYPENYIEPELRDNKTELFEQLETELLQKEINAQTVLDAYAKYMRGFEEIASLKIAGSYLESGASGKSDILHLFGVTPSDPYTYYYRTVENVVAGEIEKGPYADNPPPLIWSPWKKLDVQISADKVSPIIARGKLHVFWVDYSTSPVTKVEMEEGGQGGAKFTGYKHKEALRYTTLRLDGTWSAPQSVSLFGQAPFLRYGEGVIMDGIGAWTVDGQLRSRLPYYDRRNPVAEKHEEPQDGYSLRGFLWDRVYPAIGTGNSLFVMGSACHMTAKLNFYKNKIIGRPAEIYGPPNVQGDIGYYKVLCSKPAAGKMRRKLFRGEQSRDAGFYMTPYILHQYHIWASSVVFHYAFNSAVLSQERIDDVMNLTFGEDLLAQYGFDMATHTGITRNTFEQGLYLDEIAELSHDADIQIVNGSIADAIVDVDGDILLLQGSVRSGDRYVIKRIGTTLAQETASILFENGVHSLLDIDTQKTLKEAVLPIMFKGNFIEDKGNAGKLDLAGPLGVYYEEIFFFIPFLIANQLNSQQKFSEAQSWYHYLFNPTYSDSSELGQPGLNALQKKAIERDWNWQYLGFRHQGVETLRDQLRNTTAIAMYKRDPFNPYAIARLRLNAFQKTIVMKYIDNLLDWGDRLFARDTMESINEATLLYTLAADILGPRPAELGECGDGELKPKNYETVNPLLANGTDFLVEIEHLFLRRATNRPAEQQILDKSGLGGTRGNFLKHSSDERSGVFKGIDWNRSGNTTWISNADRKDAGGVDAVIDALDHSRSKNPSKLPGLGTGDMGLALVRQLSPVFCIPENKDFKRYWDRVEDRLFKIRHCRNISGERRQLALFAPEIDPRLLVRARAGGLSIDDVMNALSGELPPYRFRFIIERARNYASVLQGFGSSLSSAIEKKDTEELTRLRLVHQQNIGKLTTQLREMEIKDADESIKSLERNQDAVKYRLKHFEDLVSQGLIPWEMAQSVTRHVATILRGVEGGMHLMEGIFFLIPQLGSPFAMKYGGQELGSSADGFAEWLRSMASVAEAISASAGLEATFQRRDQDWRHQIRMAEHELKQLEKQLASVRIRKEIAQHALTIHREDLKQQDEVFDFYNTKFSGEGLYTWLSTTLQRLYREAYNNAYAVARVAEQAYHFERGDTNESFIGTGYWDVSRAGLLAGEQLAVDLQRMEKRFLETDYRTLEIDQSFSLTQIDPGALIMLREHGECMFDIPELFFDLFYPGHYKRRIKTVRLTIPCITGPYTNISATLTLRSSEIRNEPDLAVNRTVIPPSRTSSIATSKAQNDGGVFEMNFRDDRYMPFEGAGAISSWTLKLPRHFRQFDYQTINDVIIHVGYTAEKDELLTDQVERITAGNEGAIYRYLENNSLSRILSFRQEFSSDYHRILHSPKNSDVGFDIMDKHFPIFMQGRNLVVKKAVWVVQPVRGQDVGALTVSVDGVDFGGFATDANMGGLYAKDLANLFDGGIIGRHTIRIKNEGSLAPEAPAAGDLSALDQEKIKDMFLYLEYGL